MHPFSSVHQVQIFSTDVPFVCRAERQFGTFSALDACNYALNIYDEGATLSIVTDTGSHGTHVAGIVAACNRPDGGDGGDGGEVATSVMAPFEGVAPGAQIVSCKIGDNRVMVCPSAH